jgi:hypothetical protein
MSTRANIRVDAIGDKGACVGQRDFHVITDGHDKEGIRDCFEAAVDQWKGKVKSSHLALAVLNQLDAESTAGYACLWPGLIEDFTFVDYTWRVEIGPRGRVSIRQ